MKVIGWTNLNALKYTTLGFITIPVMSDLRTAVARQGTHIATESLTISASSVPFAYCQHGTPKGPQTETANLYMSIKNVICNCVKTLCMYRFIP